MAVPGAVACAGEWTGKGARGPRMPHPRPVKLASTRDRFSLELEKCLIKKARSGTPPAGSSWDLCHLGVPSSPGGLAYFSRLH